MYFHPVVFLILVLSCSSNSFCDFQVESSPRSYLEAFFNDVKENVFPANVEVNVSFADIAGTFLYSCDGKRNQLIVKMSDPDNPKFVISFQGKDTKISMKDLCNCSNCRYVPLDITIRIDRKLNFGCNKNLKEIQLVERCQYCNDSKDCPWRPLSKNQAIFYLVNTPSTNGQQMGGCIFDVRYKGISINMKQNGKGIKTGCSPYCNNSVCDGRTCKGTWKYANCDCLLNYGSGNMCDDVSRPMNMAFEIEKTFKIIKLSWNTNVRDILTARSRNVMLKIRQEQNSVYLEYEYHTGFGKQVGQNMRLHNHSMEKNHFIVLNFGQIFTISLDNQLHQTSFGNLGEESFIHLNLSSGTGKMDMVYKAEYDNWIRQNENKQTDYSKPTTSIPNDASEKPTFSGNNEILLGLLCVLVALLILLFIIYMVNPKRFKKMQRCKRYKGTKSKDTDEEDENKVGIEGKNDVETIHPLNGVESAETHRRNEENKSLYKEGMDALKSDADETTTSDNENDDAEDEDKYHGSIETVQSVILRQTSLTRKEGQEHQPEEFENLHHEIGKSVCGHIQRNSDGNLRKIYSEDPSDNRRKSLSCSPGHSPNSHLTYKPVLMESENGRLSQAK